MLTATLQSHRSQRKIKFLQKGSKSNQWQQYLSSAPGGARCLLHHQEAWREGPPKPQGFAHQNSVQRQASENPREQSSLWIYPTFPTLTRWIERNPRNRHSQRHRPLGLYLGWFHIFPSLLPTHIHAKKLGTEKHNPPLPLHQAAILLLSRVKL